MLIGVTLGEQLWVAGGGLVTLLVAGGLGYWLYQEWQGVAAPPADTVDKRNRPHADQTEPLPDDQQRAPSQDN
ncbi:MAG: hypothetical protein KKB50_16680 [Planctomycetes bacterium]|nr:hypothetical protein [Planctomycetota bacterium]